MKLLVPHRCTSPECRRHLLSRDRVHFVMVGDFRCPICSHKSLMPLELVHFLVEDSKGGVKGAYPGYLRQRMRIVCDKGNYYLSKKATLNKRSPLVPKAYSTVRSAVTCAECLRQMGVDVTNTPITS